MNGDTLDSAFLVRNIGERCPFCNKNWSDNSACGDSPYKSWQQQNDEGIFFPGRLGLVKQAKKCAYCHATYMGKSTQMYCSESCGDKAYRRNNLDRKRASDRARQARHRAKLRELRSP